MPENFKFSIAFQSDKTSAQYEELAEVVDRYPLEVVSVYNDLLFQPAIPALMLMARKLRHAQLGPAALNPYTMHPLEIAGQIAALDALSEGRAYLGLVRGSWLDRLGIEPSRPVQTLREAAQLVNHLLEGREEAFEGQIFKLAAGAKLNYKPFRSHIPLLIGTWGVQTARMAGEIADEIKVGGTANPALVAHLQPVLAEGSRKTGRADDAVGIALGAVVRYHFGHSKIIPYVGFAPQYDVINLQGHRTNQLILVGTGGADFFIKPQESIFAELSLERFTKSNTSTGRLEVGVKLFY